MAFTGAKPFLKNISRETHAKASADNTRTTSSLKTEQKTRLARTYTGVSVAAGVRPAAVVVVCASRSAL